VTSTNLIVQFFKMKVKKHLANKIADVALSDQYEKKVQIGYNNVDGIEACSRSIIMKAMILNRLWDLSQTTKTARVVHIPTNPSQRRNPGAVSACECVSHELDEIEVAHLHPVSNCAGASGGWVRRADWRSAQRFKPGDRVGIAWIYSACGVCLYCQRGEENLCADFQATGRDAHGGYAEYMLAPEQFAYPIPGSFTDSEAAPLLCAGAIGYRSLRLAEFHDGDRLGLTGFGASAHIVLRLALFQYPNSQIFVFSRSPAERQFAPIRSRLGWRYRRTRPTRPARHYRNYSRLEGSG
jgi:propanol-preferring alcohol dehydrogenase